MLIQRNRRTDPIACSLQPEIWHVPSPFPLLQGPVLSGGQWFPPATVWASAAHSSTCTARKPLWKVPGDFSSVAVFLRNSFRNFQARWNVPTGFSVAITPILRNPFNLLRSQADTHNLCEATEQWRAGKELKKPLSSFIQKHFHLPITFHRSSFTSWRKYRIAD